ncbi:hypothetical protein MMC07_009178 [Pseudocyphellaria aurata]|nr:hypothetical protein [Pseudocyphellaria aurata]
MPLHLLGKKSWHVYNADNVAKVKHDEALAAAREAGEEQRMQEVDSERRIRILRGLKVTTPPPSSDGQTGRGQEGGHDGIQRERKKRRLAGEDDTDRDIRLAQEHSVVKHELVQPVRPSSDAPLTDRKGNINLFPEEGTSRRHAPKNVEAEAEAAKKKKEFEDQYTMRFSNAAGFKQAVGQKPWYHPINGHAENEEVAVTKDVWGNDDPSRKERERTRLVAEDPLAAIQKGVEELREVKKERKRWKEERGREMRIITEADRARARRKRRSRQGQDVGGRLGSAERENEEHEGLRERDGFDRSGTGRKNRRSKADEDLAAAAATAAAKDLVDIDIVIITITTIIPIVVIIIPTATLTRSPSTAPGLPILF